MNKIAEYIKNERKNAGLTQEEFAMRSGLSLKFVRDLEQGKPTVRMDKVAQALSMFGKEPVPGDMERRETEEI
ncbi:helix-turn-helix transcriptional regulator [Candidatus Saccharibacteria bacterium]|nr:helix-turn-helix transcriptional regulator [Candidatus Saccharibacteria bacterium]